MRLSTSLRNFVRFSAPAVFAAKATYPAYRTQTGYIVVMGGIASALEAGALGLIYFLIAALAGDQADFRTPEFLETALGGWLQSPVLISITFSLLLLISIQIKRMNFAMTVDISQRSGIFAADQAANRARGIVTSDPQTKLTEKNTRDLMKFVSSDVPVACGFAARSFSASLIHFIQALVLTLVLFYLSPVLTLLMLLMAIVFVSFLSLSFENILESRDKRKQVVSEYREEVKDLGPRMTDPEISDEAFSRSLQEALQTGGTHRQLTARLSLKRERETGSLILEYIYPFAIVVIALMYTYLGDLAPDITLVALYILLTRQVIVSVYAIGKLFMSFSRHHHSLSKFQLLMTSTALPPELLEESDEDDAEGE